MELPFSFRKYSSESVEAAASKASVRGRTGGQSRFSHAARYAAWKSRVVWRGREGEGQIRMVSAMPKTAKGGGCERGRARNGEVASEMIAYHRLHDEADRGRRVFRVGASRSGAWAPRSARREVEGARTIFREKKRVHVPQISVSCHLIRGGHICGGSNRPHVSQRLVVRCDFASDHDRGLRRLCPSG